MPLKKDKKVYTFTKEASKETTSHEKSHGLLFKIHIDHKEGKVSVEFLGTTNREELISAMKIGLQAFDEATFAAENK